VAQGRYPNSGARTEMFTGFKDLFLPFFFIPLWTDVNSFHTH